MWENVSVASFYVKETALVWIIYVHIYGEPVAMLLVYDCWYNWQWFSLTGNVLGVIPEKLHDCKIKK